MGLCRLTSTFANGKQFRRQLRTQIKVMSGLSTDITVNRIIRALARPLLDLFIRKTLMTDWVRDVEKQKLSVVR